MLKTILDTVFNGLLLGASGYAMYSLKPADHPFAFAASAVGLCHACTGICSAFLGRANGSQGKRLDCAKMFTTSCMEIVTVPLINMDLYSGSQQTNSLALGHGLFIIPLGFDLTFRVFANQEDEDDATAILKDLTILGNTVSLLFYATNENNLAAGIMALAGFFAYYGSIWMENMLPGTGENSSLAGYALFLGLILPAMEAAKSS